MLIVLGGSAAACGSLKTTPPEPSDTLMNATLPSDALIRRDDRGIVYYVKGENLSGPLESSPRFRKLQSENNLAEISLFFISAHHDLFALSRPEAELTVLSAVTDDLGLSHVKFQQVYRKIPVWGSEMIVHLDRENRVYLVQGRHIPTPDGIRLQPDITAADAARIVARDLDAHSSKCPMCRTELVIYTPEATGRPCLAYRISASMRPDAGWMYFIDASTGEILEKLSTVRTGG